MEKIDTALLASDQPDSNICIRQAFWYLGK